MGLYDSVRVKCPNCGSKLEFQSKAGDCTLNCFRLAKVPIEIANDLNSEITICVCGKQYEIFSAIPLDYVSMNIMEV